MTQTHLNNLSDFLNSKIPKGFWAVHTLMEQQYAKLLKEYHPPDIELTPSGFIFDDNNVILSILSKTF